MALDLLVELEIVKAKDCVTSPRRSPTDEARRWRRDTRPPCWWAVSAAAVVLSSSGSRDAAKRSMRCTEPFCLGGGARTATPSRSQRAALRCARRPSAFLFLAASGSLGRMLMARAPLVDDRLWPCHTARPSVAQRQEAAAALASSTALVTGYLCKRGRQRWLVSESDASTNFRGSNRPLSARRTASSKS